jgi:hypothetical protein
VQVLLTSNILHVEFGNDDYVICIKKYHCVFCIPCLKEVMFLIVQ